eukprot:17643-Heterococcus_DN1.PRE.4
MVKKVRAGHSVDINKLEKLSVRRYYSVAIAAIGFFSLLVGAWLQRTASDNIMHAVYARAAIGPGNVDLAWSVLSKLSDSRTVLSTEQSVVAAACRV